MYKIYHHVIRFITNKNDNKEMATKLCLFLQPYIEQGMTDFSKDNPLVKIACKAGIQINEYPDENDYLFHFEKNDVKAETQG